jgi:hypothetical protein
MPVLSAPVFPGPQEKNRNPGSDLAAIQNLVARIDSYIASGTITEEELSALELALQELKARYGGQ